MDLNSILKVDSELNRIKDYDLLLERILLEARRVANADAGSIYVPEFVIEDGVKVEKLAFKYSQNETLEKMLPPGEKLIYAIFKAPISEKTISGYCALTKEIVNVPDVYNLPGGVPYSFGVSYDKSSGYKTTSMLTIPLLTVTDKLLGVIQVINARDRNGVVIPFNADVTALVSHFASSAAHALERAASTRSMILRMIRMAELRDPKETGAHVNRVAGYALDIYDRYAERAGIEVDVRVNYRDTIRVASMLHDVGKVAISDLILKKPARFTPEEFLEMQRHTSYGASLFDDLLSETDMISRDIALSHHENWDGTGYPEKRKREDIPLVSRIAAIADVYDALCSKRVYKEPWSEKEVLEEIRKMSGTKFDPFLTDIFFEALPSIKQTMNLYPEV